MDNLWLAPLLPCALQVADGEHALNLAGVESSSAAAELLTTRQVGSRACFVVLLKEGSCKTVWEMVCSTMDAPLLVCCNLMHSH